MKLEEIAVKYGTDKQCQNGHGYVEFYEKYFEPMMNDNITLLELGVREGWSTNMWVEYFPNGQIWGIDNDKEGLCPKSFENPRIHFSMGSQDDESFLSNICEDVGGFDVIIDDASHISKLSIRSFEILFPHVKPGGLYIIEDLHVCHLTEYNPDRLSTIEYFDRIVLDDIMEKNLYLNKILFIRKGN